MTFKELLNQLDGAKSVDYQLHTPKTENDRGTCDIASEILRCSGDDQVLMNSIVVSCEEEEGFLFVDLMEATGDWWLK